MSWKVVLTHGNEAQEETVAEDFWKALEWIREQEESRHGRSGAACLEEMARTFTWGSEETGSVQYGMNYHYVNLAPVVGERVAD